MPERPGSRVLRVFKTGSALGVGQVLSILFQLVIPPTFLRSYGVHTYGEWLALSSGVSWLTSLDFGLQIFIGNQLSIEFFEGRLQRFRDMQSVALRITLGMIAAGATLIGALLLLVPMNRVLHLSMSRSSANSIAFFLAIQILISILIGQLNGAMRAVGFPHRAESWGQFRLGLGFAATWILAAMARPLWWIPIAQVLAYIVTGLCSLWDLRRLAPEATPTLSYWDRDMARLILKPSLWFGTFTLNQFLLFESPVLILNWFVGKPAVVAFSLCRTYFGMIRQPVNVIRFALRPELTRLAALKEWDIFGRAYRALASLSFSAAFICTPLALLAAPALLPLWTKRSDMFGPQLYTAMGLATLLIIAKDCRLDLQHSTNRHIRSAAFCLVSYGAYTLLAIPAAIAGGVLAVVLLWAAVEGVQVALIHSENKRLLPSLNLRDVGTLVLWGSMAVLAAGMLTTRLEHSGIIRAGAWGLGIASVLVAAALALFNLSGTAQLLRDRLLRRGFDTEVVEVTSAV